VRVEAPTLTDWAAALLSLILLVLSFPDFDLWPLAWVGFVPLMLVIARKPAPGRAFVLGWLTGSVFFYASCYWLTYSMVHFGHLPAWMAYLLLVPGALVLGLFPASFAAVLAKAIKRWGNKALFVGPFVWVALEWARLEITGQLWNAIGYSQAYEPVLIQVARWGGVYAVGFLILTVNAALTFPLLNRCKRGLAISLGIISATALVICASYASRRVESVGAEPVLEVVALQPNVPMDPSAVGSEMQELSAMHVAESTKALKQVGPCIPKLVIWPESPMSFAYGGDPQLQNVIAEFTKQNNTSLLFNSQERASTDGIYNSAILVNEDGRAIGQYDKIRLLPFGEYVPLPSWVPGASLIRGIVGDFTPGDKYTLMSLGRVRAGVFICIESAYPWIAQTLTDEGADLLINISNDGYLGPTAVMRQHLANAILRAVENDRTLLRVTNSGITAYITNEGQVRDATNGFERTLRTWTIHRDQTPRSFYTRHPSVFVVICLSITVLALIPKFGR
jgi:apolipoprotein N-acyltransferase